MAKAPRKIGEGEYRFDCECGRIHIFSNESGESGKLKVETIEPNKQPKQKADDDSANSDTATPRKKGFLENLGI